MPDPPPVTTAMCSSRSPIISSIPRGPVAQTDISRPLSRRAAPSLRANTLTGLCNRAQCQGFASRARSVTYRGGGSYRDAAIGGGHPRVLRETADALAGEMRMATNNAYLMARAQVANESDRAKFDQWYGTHHLPLAMDQFRAEKGWRLWSRIDPS